VNNSSLATGKNFDAGGLLDAKANVEVLSEASARSIAAALPAA
jgi:hypothetical protein